MESTGRTRLHSGKVERGNFPGSKLSAALDGEEHEQNCILG